MSSQQQKNKTDRQYGTLGGRRGDREAESGKSKGRGKAHRKEDREGDKLREVRKREDERRVLNKLRWETF